MEFVLAARRSDCRIKGLHTETHEIYLNCTNGDVFSESGAHQSVVTVLCFCTDITGEDIVLVSTLTMAFNESKHFIVVKYQ